MRICCAGGARDQLRPFAEAGDRHHAYLVGRLQGLEHGFRLT